MVTGASTANMAILLVDARKGIITQTKRHSFLSSLLGIKHLLLCVNKMDLVDYSQDVYNKIVEDYKQFITGLNIPDLHIIPISALKGENVVDLSNKMPWYKGKSVLNLLETIHINSDRNFEDLRFPVQYVIRPTFDYRGFAATIASGVIRKGDEIMALPSRKKSKVKRIVTYDGDLDYAFPPQSVNITLEDEIDISRGEMIVHPNSLPRIEKKFEAMLVWMDEDKMDLYNQYYIKHNTNSTKAKIEKIQHKINVNTLEKEDCEFMELNEIARVVISTTKPLFFDPYKVNRQTGAFVLIDPVSHNTAAVGMIIDKIDSKELSSNITNEDQQNIVRGNNLVTKEDLEKRYQQKPSTIWITGLHGSGKNELAYSLEKELFDQGATVFLIDGKSARSGLSKELDHSPSDRAEHLRRIANICKMLNDRGIICIASFISPDENERQQIAQIIGNDKFKLIHLDADLDFCKKNDKYGLYKKAETSDIKYLAGINIEYQKPEKPRLTLIAGNREGNISKIMAMLETDKIFPIE
jgi:adenylyl-sulfate kinase